MDIAKYSNSNKIIVEKSTVPVKTADYIKTIFQANRKYPNIEFEILSNPEFLSEVIFSLPIITKNTIKGRCH